jgi:hypothetical protein
MAVICADGATAANIEVLRRGATSSISGFS